MWYEKEKKALNFDLPIFAETTSGEPETYLLMPQISKSRGYVIVGYNWFRVAKGTYNSCSFFKTPREAINAYEYGHKIFNGDIVVNKK